MYLSYKKVTEKGMLEVALVFKYAYFSFSVLFFCSFDELYFIKTIYDIASKSGLEINHPNNKAFIFLSKTVNSRYCCHC